MPRGVEGLGTGSSCFAIRWDGFLKSPLSEEYTFVIDLGAGDAVR